MISLPASFGKAFIISALMPAFLFVLLNGLFVTHNDLTVIGALIFPSDVKRVDLTPVLILALLIPVILGVLLSIFNTFIIRFFEGAHGFQRHFLLKWLLNQKAKQHEALYGNLQAYKKRLEETGDELERRGLQKEISNIHQQLYTGYDGAGFNFPYDKARLMPTLFGNVWGVIEEYPYLRYGMDGTTFWPRMISVVPKEYTEMISDNKMTMDTLLNLALLGFIFGVEMIAVSAQQFNWLNVMLTAGAFIAVRVFYRMAVSSLLRMGELIKSCYDLFRGALISKFGLTIPTGDIEAERKIWSGLNSYILAGEAYYYPSLPPKS